MPTTAWESETPTDRSLVYTSTATGGGLLVVVGLGKYGIYVGDYPTEDSAELQWSEIKKYLVNMEILSCHSIQLLAKPHISHNYYNACMGPWKEMKSSLTTVSIAIGTSRVSLTF